MSRDRLIEWTKVVAIVLAAGPPIGGLVLALIIFLIDPRHTMRGGVEMLPVFFVTLPLVSHIGGVPVAVIALALFLPSQYFIKRGTVYLAMICGALATGIALFILAATSPKGIDLQSLTDVGSYGPIVVMFAIPSVIAAWACWRITRRFHRLQ
jgi:hypothetical protein